MASGGRIGNRTAGGRTAGGRTGRPARAAAGHAAGRRATSWWPMDLRLPPTPAPELPALTERERLGDSYSVLSLDANRQVISLIRPEPQHRQATMAPGPCVADGDNAGSAASAATARPTNS